MFDWVSDLFSKFFSWLLGLLPGWLGNGWDQLAAAFGPIAQYFAYLSALDVVAPTIVGAYVVRFLIRRIPLVG